MALLDAKGDVLELNAAAGALLGGTTGSIGRAFWSLPWWPNFTDVEREGRQQAMQDAIGRCASGEEIRTRAELVDAGGVRRVIDFSLRPVRDPLGVTTIVAEGRDITALLSN